MKTPPLFLFLFLLLVNVAFSQDNKPDELNVLFYNLENLFDTSNDSIIQDDEFLPQGKRHWTKQKFQTKLKNISKVILSSCDFEMPDIVGVCEVENKYVLNQLVKNTPLKKYGYRIIHKDSPDPRGIDVAIIYRNEKCTPLYFEYIPLLDERGNVIRSREILYAKYELLEEDTLHVFFNHWPSRYGGQSETEHKRVRAGIQLKDKIDQLYKKYTKPKIVVMGDFNDNPDNKSLSESLLAKNEDTPLFSNELINLSAGWNSLGTLKHQQSWFVFDQILVSDHLLKVQSGWFAKPSNAQIVNLDFLFQNDPKYQGKRLFRTYYGMKYQGGFSDHLPIRLKLTYSD